MEDLEVRTDAGRRGQGAPPQQDPALQIGRRAGLLGPLGHREDHVREGRGLREHHIGHREEVQCPDALFDVGGAGRGDDGVGAHQEQGAYVPAQRVQQLVRAAPGAREGLRRYAPHLRDVRPRGRVGQLAVARQLVGLLAVFAAALPVALAGQAPVAGVRAAGAAGRQAQVDPGTDRVRALGLLLGAAGREHHGAVRRAEVTYGGAELGDRYAGDALDQFRPVRHRRGPRRRPAAGARRDELLVRTALRHHQVQQTEREGQVGAGARCQVQVGLLGRTGTARVDDDQPAAVLLQLRQVAQRGRHGFGQVGADQDDAAGAGDVGQREGQPAVQTEGPLVRGGGRGHAEPAVVVDLRRAEHHPRELAQRVRLLVGQPAPAEDAHRVLAVRGARTGQARGDPREGGVPVRRYETAGRRVADQRLGQPGARREQVGGGTALAAQGTPVDGEGGALHHLGGSVRGARRESAQTHAALEGAVRAVGVHGRARELGRTRELGRRGGGGAGGGGVHTASLRRPCFRRSGAALRAGEGRLTVSVRGR